MKAVEIVALNLIVFQSFPRKQSSVENEKLTRAPVIKIFLVLMASAQVLCQ